jgi:pyrroline-5-carboxylate reductase
LKSIEKTNKFKLGVLGIGNMGGSILNGIINASIYPNNEICIYDIDQDKIKKYQDLGLSTAKCEKELIENVEMLLLAIKPQMLCALENLTLNINNLIVISIVAGKTVSDLKQIFGNQKFIRVMPNTPALINEGATAIARTQSVTDEEFNSVKQIFASIGVVEEIDDNLMNEIIPVNGSMPAFLYYFAKCFIDKALKDGISYEVAKSLCVQAIIGSAKMIANTDKSIDELIKDVCSPKGATLEGLKVFEQHHINEIIEEVADATIKRAYELSKI